MKKKELRKIYSEKRNALSVSDGNRLNDLILIQFQKLSLPAVTTVFSYLAMDSYHEIGTDAIVSYLEFMNPGLQVAYPVCNFDAWTMKAVPTDAETNFIKNRFGTTEPDCSTTLDPREIDLVIVPLLCFDKEGYRVGYGKGFYDKFLGETRVDTIKAGLSYFEPVDKIDDTNEFDVTLDYCVTPEKIYEF